MKYTVIDEEGIVWGKWRAGHSSFELSPEDEVDRLTNLADMILGSVSVDKESGSKDGAYIIVIDENRQIFRIIILLYMDDTEYGKVNIARVQKFKGFYRTQFEDNAVTGVKANLRKGQSSCLS